MALLAPPLFHLAAVAVLEKCITTHHIPYLQGLIQSHWATAALVDHKVALPKMDQIVYSELLLQLGEATAAMATALLRATAARVVALQEIRAPEGHQ